MSVIIKKIGIIAGLFLLTSTGFADYHTVYTGEIGFVNLTNKTLTIQQNYLHGAGGNGIFSGSDPKNIVLQPYTASQSDNTLQGSSKHNGASADRKLASLKVYDGDPATQTPSYITIYTPYILTRDATKYVISTNLLDYTSRHTQRENYSTVFTIGSNKYNLILMAPNKPGPTKVATIYITPASA